MLFKSSLSFFFFFSIFSTIGMLIYSIHTQRDHTAKHLCLSNIGYFAKCSVPWSILIQVALEIHAPIHSLIACSWSRAAKTLLRRKSGNNKTIVVLGWWLNIRGQKSGLVVLIAQLFRSSNQIAVRNFALPEALAIWPRQVFLEGKKQTLSESIS